jgi:hypothetical protein
MTKIDKYWFCECGDFEYIATEDYSNFALSVFLRKRTGKIGGPVYWGDFEERFLSAHQLAVEVWRGHAFCALFGESRKYDDFIGAWHMCLDFDDNHGHTLKSICENEFVMEHASFVHTTTSHTADKPRLRVVFLLPVMITSIDDYKDIAAAINEKFPNCETVSTGNPSKPWSGAKDCEIKGLWSYVFYEVLEKLRKRGKELRKVPTVEKSDFVRLAGGNYQKYINVCFDNAAGEIAKCKPTDTNNRFYNAAVKLFNLAAARWNDTSANDVMSWLENETGGFWGGRHRGTAESAMTKGLKQEAKEPDGIKVHSIGIGGLK